MPLEQRAGFLRPFFLAMVFGLGIHGVAYAQQGMPTAPKFPGQQFPTKQGMPMQGQAPGRVAVPPQAPMTQPPKTVGSVRL